MRFKSKRDGWFKAVVWLTVLMIVTALVFIPEEDRLIGFVIGIPMICLLLWIYFGSYFELRDTYLLCRVGPFAHKIYYDKVTSAITGEGILTSMALSKQHIEITQSGKGFLLGTTYISPERREEFLDELQKRCPQLR